MYLAAIRMSTTALMLDIRPFRPGHVTGASVLSQTLPRFLGNLFALCSHGPYSAALRPEQGC